MMASEVTMYVLAGAKGSPEAVLRLEPGQRTRGPFGVVYNIALVLSFILDLY
jgi:hypothetical protein